MSIRLGGIHHATAVSPVQWPLRRTLTSKPLAKSTFECSRFCLACNVPLCCWLHWTIEMCVCIPKCTGGQWWFDCVSGRQEVCSRRFMFEHSTVSSCVSFSVQMEHL